MSTSKSVIPDSNIFVIKEYVSPEYPYVLPFYLDDDTIAVNKASLAYEISRINELTGQVINSGVKLPLAIFIDGVFREATTDSRGLIDLTTWISTPGWHELDIKSNSLIQIRAQFSIKSCVAM